MGRTNENQNGGRLLPLLCLNNGKIVICCRNLFWLVTFVNNVRIAVKRISSWKDLVGVLGSFWPKVSCLTFEPKDRSNRMSSVRTIQQQRFTRNVLTIRQRTNERRSRQIESSSMADLAHGIRCSTLVPAGQLRVVRRNRKFADQTSERRRIVDFFDQTNAFSAGQRLPVQLPANLRQRTTGGSASQSDRLVRTLFAFR